MLKQEVAQKIDHAVLNPGDGDKEVIKACETAKKFNTASVCVKPCDVKLAKAELEGSKVKVCSVVGFPHGGTTAGMKCAEAVEAIKNGAEEIDMVMNIGKLKEGEFEYVKKEIEFATTFVHETGKTLKVIIETALLNDEEKIIASKIVEQAGADYVKTSTGFSSEGAKLEDIRLIKETLGDKIKIKASGGIKTYEQAVSFIEAGCQRIGTSRTQEILQ